MHREEEWGELSGTPEKVTTRKSTTEEGCTVENAREGMQKGSDEAPSPQKNILINIIHFLTNDQTSVCETQSEIRGARARLRTRQWKDSSYGSLRTVPKWERKISKIMPSPMRACKHEDSVASAIVSMYIFYQVYKKL